METGQTQQGPSLASRKPSARVVVVDPGHGGHDSGARASGAEEKHLALGIALELRHELAGYGLHVVPSREEDLYLTLGARVKAAKDARADVFVSIHLNADPDNDAPGSREASGYEILYTSRQPLSKRLAEMTEHHLAGVQGIKSRGIKLREELYVIKHAPCPAILVECGFIDSSHDRALLSAPKFQARFARYLAAGVSAFLVS